MFDNVKHIYFRTLLGNQQILWLILTKINLILNKPFTFLIVLSTPPDINDSTPANQKKKQNRKTFTWEPVHASKATLWNVINLFTKSCKTNALFLIANLCLCKRYVYFFVTLCCLAYQQHHFSLQKQLLTDDHGSFKQKELFFCFEAELLRQKESMYPVRVWWQIWECVDDSWIWHTYSLFTKHNLLFLFHGINKIMLNRGSNLSYR